MLQKLSDYRALLDTYLQAERDPYTSRRPETVTRRNLRSMEPTVKEILKRLDPELANFDLEARGGDANARNAVDRGLGILAEREEWKANLGPDGPVVAADQFHPWVWQAALTLWDSKHYRQAVHAAATAITAHTQTKLGRTDVADDALMQEAFSENPPQPGKPRLRCPGDPNDQTVKSRQRGARQYAVACYFAIRNPAAHETSEWDQQVALEYLAALSVLARWIDGWTVDTAP
jgi:hypothetical protein